MSLEFCDTHCCIISEINNLADYVDQPKNAMITFCKAMIGKRMGFKGYTGYPGAMYSAYMFSSAIYKVGNERYSSQVRSDKLTINNEGVYWLDYGTQFADFIKSNKLGTLISTDILSNKAYHPDHFNRVWIWTVDVAAITAWWAIESVEIAKAEAEAAKALAARQAALEAKKAEADAKKIKDLAEATAKANLGNITVTSNPTFKTVLGVDGILRPVATTVYWSNEETNL